MQYILILLSILFSPPTEYELSCVEGRSLERTHRAFEGRSFDGVRFIGNNGTYKELFHPIAVTSRGSRIEFEDPFGNTIKTSVSRLVDYTTLAGVFDFVSACEDASQNKLTDSIIAGIKEDVLAPDLIIGEMGTLSAPNFSTAEIANLGNASLITKEYADANYSGGGSSDTIVLYSYTPTKTGTKIGNKELWVAGMSFLGDDWTGTLGADELYFDTDLSSADIVDIKLLIDRRLGSSNNAAQNQLLLNGKAPFDNYEVDVYPDPLRLSVTTAAPGQGSWGGKWFVYYTID